MMSSDGVGYEQQALALLATRSFVSDPQHPDRYEIFRVPGYPAFLAGVYALVGAQRLAVIVVQLAVGAGSVALAWLVARRVWDARVAGYAAVMLAADPLSAHYALLLLSETVFAFSLVCLLVLAGLTLTRKRAWTWGLGLGFCWAATVMIRPVTYYYLVPLLALVGIVKCAAKTPGRRSAVLLLAIAAPALLLVGAWQWRNYARTGYAGISIQNELSLLFCRGAGIEAARDGLSLEEARKRILGRLAVPGIMTLYDLPYLHEPPPAETAARCRHLAVDLVRQHPWLAARNGLLAAARMLLGPGSLAAFCRGQLDPAVPDAALGGRPITDLWRLSLAEYVEKWLWAQPFAYGVYVYQVLYLGVLLVAVGGGLVRAVACGRAVWPWHALLLVTLVYLVLASATDDAQSRYRMPLMPLLCCYAGAGLAGWIGNRRSLATVVAGSGQGRAPRNEGVAFSRDAGRRSE
jgi:4-amino-4-deoxy-L-arabinose transferase-like glycosyltransferase